MIGWMNGIPQMLDTNIEQVIKLAGILPVMLQIVIVKLLYRKWKSWHLKHFMTFIHINLFIVFIFTTSLQTTNNTICSHCACVLAYIPLGHLLCVPVLGLSPLKAATRWSVFLWTKKTNSLELLGTGLCLMYCAFTHFMFNTAELFCRSFIQVRPLQRGKQPRVF